MLDWTNFDGLWVRRNTLVTPGAKYSLELLEEKITFQPDLFARPRQNYSAMAGLILLANDYRQRRNFVTCMLPKERSRLGIKKHEHQPDNCGLVWCCAHCAWRREMDAQCRYLSAYQPGNVWAVTVSFTGHLALNPAEHDPTRHRPATHADVTVYWDAVNHALRVLYDEDLIRGAIVKEELHILGLLPVPLVLPHCHMTVWADSFGEAERVRMEQLIQCYCACYPDFGQEDEINRRWAIFCSALDRFKSREIKTKPRRPACPQVVDPTATVDLPLSVRVDPLNARADLAGVLGYPFKPCNLTQVYQRERQHLIDTRQTKKLGRLADCVEEVILAHEVMISPRRQPQYIGACNPTRRSEYIGQPGTMVRDPEFQDATKVLLKELSEERVARNQNENGIPST